jgi:hypothetical protein
MDLSKMLKARPAAEEVSHVRESRLADSSNPPDAFTVHLFPGIG